MTEAESARLDTSVPRRFDPRAMVLAAAVLVAVSLTTRSGVPAMLLLFGFVCSAHAFVSRRFSATAPILARLAPFALLIVVLNTVLVPGDALLSVAGWRVVSREGLAAGVFFALRLGVMVVSVSTMLAATTAEGLARACYDVVRPLSRRTAAQAALFVFLAMGFAPLFADEFQRIRTAQSFRGGELSGGLWRRVWTVRSWLVPLILSAINRSAQLALAVELRDVRSRLPRTIEAPRFRAADVVALALTAAVVVAVTVVG